VAPALLVGSLLAVVVGHTLLAQGQVRLSSLTTQLSNEQVRHRADILALTQLETPSRVVVEAEKKLGMVTPAQIVQLPSVPLDRPLPAPTLAPAPAPPTTSPVAATATGSSSGAASGGATVTSTTAAGGSPPASGR